MTEIEPIDSDDAELALARLEWAQAAGCCLDLPSQREAMEWHVACSEAALALVAGRPADGGTA